MKISRRSFLRTSAAGWMVLAGGGGGGAASIAAVRAFAADGPGKAAEYFTWKSLRDKAAAAIGEGGNSLVLSGSGQTILVDCKMSAFGSVLKRESLGRFPGALTIINTHHHADHTGGNHAMKADGVKIYAHANCKKRVLAGDTLKQYQQHADAGARSVLGSDRAEAKAVATEVEACAKAASAADADAYAPTVAVDAQETPLEIGGVKLLLMHYGPGHTDNDLVVFVPDMNVLHTGDLLFNKCHPYVDRGAGATTIGWSNNIRKTLALCDASTVVVPGHGELTDVEGLKKQIVYFDTVRDGVSKLIDAGKGRDEVAAAQIEAFKDYGLPQIRPVAMGAIYDEIMEERKR